jgi:hypothetical protein
MSRLANEKDAVILSDQREPKDLRLLLLLHLLLPLLFISKRNLLLPSTQDFSLI